MAYLFLALSAPQVLSGIIGSAQPIEDGASLYQGFVNTTLAPRNPPCNTSTQNAAAGVNLEAP